MPEATAPVRILPTTRDLLDAIDRLPISADAKALLGSLSGTTLRIGDAVVRIGQRILAFLMEAVQRFPNTAFGVLTGFVVSSLITSIPILGPVLGPLLTPLLLAFGLANGAIADIKDGALRTRVRKLEDDVRVMTARA